MLSINRKPNSVKVLLFFDTCRNSILPYQIKERLFEKLGVPYFIYACTADEYGNCNVYKRITGEEAYDLQQGIEYIDIFDTFIDHGDEVERDGDDFYVSSMVEEENVECEIRFDISRIKLAEIVGDVPGYTYTEKLPKKRLNRFKIYTRYDDNGYKNESIEEAHKELSDGELVDYGRKIY